MIFISDVVMSEKSLVNHSTSDQKSLCNGVIHYFISCIVVYALNIQIHWKQSSMAHLAIVTLNSIVAKDRLF